VNWLFSLFEWWGNTPIAHAMNGWEWSYPIVESFHIIGIVLLVGTAALVDMRLLGLRFTRMAVWEIAEELAPWTTMGLVLVLITGPLLVSTDPDRYYDSIQFRLKMSCLALAFLFDFAIHRRVRSKDRKTTINLQRFAGAVSLILWSSVVVGGRAIGVFD
jgi:hypothetical protein